MAKAQLNFGELGGGGGAEIVFDDNYGINTSSTLSAQDDSVTVTKSGTCKGTYAMYCSSSSDLKVYKNGTEQTFTLVVNQSSRYLFTGSYEFPVSAGDVIRRTTVATPGPSFFQGVLYVE